MKAKLTFIVLLFFATSNVDSRVLDINRLWNVENLAYAKAHITEYSTVIANCIETGERYASMEPLSVVNKRKSFAPDSHYYCSMSPYYWPVTSSSGKVVYKYRDGQGNPEARDYNQWTLTDLSNRLQGMALAFFFTGNDRLFDCFVKQLDVWFINPDTKMYPNFDYAQVIPGQNGDKGTSTGIIEARPLTSIIESICLLDSCRSIGSRRRNNIKRWFVLFLDWMQSSDLCQRNYKANNNIGTSFNVTLLRIALFVNSQKIVDNLIGSFPNRVNKQINANGMQPLELSRSSAFTYSTYNLWFIVEFCTIASSAGHVSVYEKCERRLKAATNYLAQFNGKEENFPYKQNNGFVASEKALNIIMSCIDVLDGKNTLSESINNIYDLIQFNVYI
jgi:hypothetical protein